MPLFSPGKSGGKGRSGKSGDNEYSFPVYASGAQEVDPVDTETTAVAHITVDKFMRYIDFEVDVFNGVDITWAHLHCGKAGENGPVVVPLLALPRPSVDGSFASGRITNDIVEGANCPGVSFPEIDSVATLVEAMLAGEVYLNIHSKAHPDGEVRGQVFFGIDAML